MSFVLDINFKMHGILMGRNEFHGHLCCMNMKSCISSGPDQIVYFISFDLFCQKMLRILKLMAKTKGYVH